MELKVGDIVKRKRQYAGDGGENIKMGDVGVIVSLGYNDITIRYFKGPILSTSQYMVPTTIELVKKGTK